MQKFLKYKNVLNNEKGGILVITLLLLVVLTLIGIAANNTSVTEVLISNATKNKQKAFYAAEAGLDHGKLIMSGVLDTNNTDATAGAGALADWSFMFNSTSPFTSVPSSAFPCEKFVKKDVVFGNYKYTISVYDDEYSNCADCNSCSDTDGVVWLRSTAVSDKFGSAAVEVSLIGQYVPPTSLKPIIGYFGQAGAGAGKANAGGDTNAMTAGDLGTPRLNQDA